MALNQNTESKKELKHERDSFLPFLGATPFIHGGRKADGSVGGWARKGFAQLKNEGNERIRKRTNDAFALLTNPSILQIKQ